MTTRRRYRKPAQFIRNFMSVKVRLDDDRRNRLRGCPSTAMKDENESLAGSYSALALDTPNYEEDSSRDAKYS